VTERVGPGAGAAEAMVVLEVLEEATPTKGCSSEDRRLFRRRTVPRLQEEFGACLHLEWAEPAPTSRTLPRFVLAGRTVHSGGYLPWEILRPMVAYALALEIGVGELSRDAAHLMASRGLDPCDWQDGLLCWLGREGS
jgi:hypothetical protein